ncbi:unnamed protein product, partial [Polarella glacialis]
PYWVQFFDAPSEGGDAQGAWLGASKVLQWADGPEWSGRRSSERLRAAVRLAQAAGAGGQPSSGEAPRVKSSSAGARAQEASTPEQRAPSTPAAASSQRVAAETPAAAKTPLPRRTPRRAAALAAMAALTATPVPRFAAASQAWLR